MSFINFLKIIKIACYYTKNKFISYKGVIQLPFQFSL